MNEANNPNGYNTRNLEALDESSIELKAQNSRKTKVEGSFVLTGTLLYGFFGVLFLIWTLKLLWDRWNEIINPVSSNGFDIMNFHQLLYPAITICNIMPGIQIEHRKCKSFFYDIECEYTPYSYTAHKSLLKHDKKTYCLTYNSNLDSAFVATKLGVQDMLFIAVRLNIKEYPHDSFLSGVLISLHSQGLEPVIEKTILASPGKLFMIRLKKVVKEYLNMTSIESFDGQVSTLDNLNFEKTWGDPNDTVVIGLAYQDLNVMVIRELPPFTILSFLSETGGILGLLMGTAIVNLAFSCLQWAWGLSLNELKWSTVQNSQEAAEKLREGNLPKRDSSEMQETKEDDRLNYSFGI